MKKIKPILGKGLDAMLGGEAVSTLTNQNTFAEGAASIAMLALRDIIPNPNQPRRSFTDDSLRELADSLKHLGLVQPITVQRLSGGQYQIISGERRYRAAQLAGLESLPAYVREVEEGDVLELALVENIQREDLTAIEIALAYQGLMEQEGATQERIAQRVGKTRSNVANYLRLLKLPAEVQVGLNERLLEMGHARALLRVEDPERLLELYHMIINEGLSVREVEDIARAIQSGNEVPASDVVQDQPQAGKKKPDETFKALEQHLGQVFGSKVRFRCNPKGKGSISIPFANEGELDRLIALLQRIQQD